MEGGSLIVSIQISITDIVKDNFSFVENNTTYLDLSSLIIVASRIFFCVYCCCVAKIHECGRHSQITRHIL